MNTPSLTMTRPEGARATLLPPRRGSGRIAWRELSLIHRFWVSITLVMACALALGLALILRSHADLQAARSSLHSLADFRVALDIANLISAERGPANRVISEGDRATDTSRLLLRNARAHTDAMISRAAASNHLAPGVASVRTYLDTARREIDRLGSLPAESFGTDEVAAAAEGMFAAYDATQSLTDLGIASLLGTGTDLVGRAVVMRSLAELRDLAGRLGSFLVIPMVHRQPIAEARVTTFQRTEGRVRALWQLAAQLTSFSENEAIRHAQEAVVSRFFGEGVALLERSLGEARTGGYTTTATEFTAAIVPTFRPLEQMRDAFIDETMAKLRERATRAQRSLLAVIGVTGVALLLVMTLLLASQSLLFQPLVRARDRVVELADGKLDSGVERAPHTGELRDLYDAIASLRVKLVERVALTEQLKRQADTDPLTGALNRRALEHLVDALCAKGPPEQPVSVIILDIDHFKRINDSCGHASGDEVLKDTARRLRGELRETDILARIGGEEFCVVFDGGSGSAAETAERLRRAMQDRPFTLSSGIELQVTASFGTATAELGPGVWPKLLATADAALYRAKSAGRNRVVNDDMT